MTAAATAPAPYSAQTGDNLDRQADLRAWIDARAAEANAQGFLYLRYTWRDLPGGETLHLLEGWPSRPTPEPEAFFHLAAG